MLKIGDLMWLRKPFTNIYKVFDIKEYWIPTDGETLTVKPLDASGYTFSRIYYYNLYSNNSGRIMSVDDPTYCSERFVVPFDKAKLLAHHHAKIQKLTVPKPTSEQLKEVEKWKKYLVNVQNNLF